MGKGNISTNRLTKAIKGSGGIMSTIAKRLRVEWHTAKTAIARDEVATRAYTNEEEKILDMCDGKLYQAVLVGDLQAIRWLQSTKGKRRGYITTQEITGKDGQAIDFSLANLPNIPTDVLIAYLQKESGV